MSRREHFDDGHGMPNHSDDGYGNVRRNLGKDPLWATYAEDLDEKAWNVIDRVAPSVVSEHQKYPLDCGGVCGSYSKHLNEAGIPHEVHDGSFIGGWEEDPRKIEPPMSRDHVWIEIGGKIFDPTASQFAGKVDSFKREHYWKGQ